MKKSALKRELGIQGIHHLWEGKCNWEVSQTRCLWGSKESPFVKNCERSAILLLRKLGRSLPTISWMLTKDCWVRNQGPYYSHHQYPEKSALSCTSSQSISFCRHCRKGQMTPSWTVGCIIEEKPWAQGIYIFYTGQYTWPLFSLEGDIIPIFWSC